MVNSVHQYESLKMYSYCGGSSYSSMGSIEPPLWPDLVLRSIDDGPNGIPPWLKEIMKAVALAHLSMPFQSKTDRLVGRASTFFAENKPKWM